MKKSTTSRTLTSKKPIYQKLLIQSELCEASDTSLSIRPRYQVNGNKIKFIGRFYTDKRLPEDGNFTVEHPPKRTVFRYYSYEILKPYKIWGPRVLEKGADSQDSLPSILEVK